MEKISIIGFGDVGKAIAKFYPNPVIKDLNQDGDTSNSDLLHICIPYNEDFIETVKKEIAIAQPDLTIIHSTVAPGTTEKIGGAVVHSPVIGKHPDLHEDIKVFKKFIGADKEKHGQKAQAHFNKLGLETALLKDSKTTELGKLLLTSYIALCAAWTGEAEKMCKHYGVETIKSLTWFTEIYNTGNTKLNQEHRNLPVLYPPHNEKIGGHCLVPNAEILKKEIDSNALDLILDYK